MACVAGNSGQCLAGVRVCEGPCIWHNTSMARVQSQTCATCLLRSGCFISCVLAGHQKTVWPVGHLIMLDIMAAGPPFKQPGRTCTRVSYRMSCSHHGNAAGGCQAVPLPHSGVIPALGASAHQCQLPPAGPAKGDAKCPFEPSASCHSRLQPNLKARLSMVSCVEALDQPLEGSGFQWRCHWAGGLY